MQIDGGCHCGHITYRADIDPERVVICHCTDCQALSGSAYRFVAFTREDALEILTGELKIYIKVADSRRARAQAFCPECGSAIYATSTGEGSKVYGLRAGTIVQRAELVPRRQIWHRSALNWVEDLRALPRSAEQ